MYTIVPSTTAYGTRRGQYLPLWVKEAMCHGVVMVFQTPWKRAWWRTGGHPMEDMHHPVPSVL